MSKTSACMAIIGMACRFPGADDYRTFWRNLEQGVNSIREIPAKRWDIDEFYSPDMDVPNKSISKWCGLLDGVDRFDHRFFNISPREAGNMDPQQRLLLEETWHCIEDSGVLLKTLQKKKTSVYVGVMTGDYRQEWWASGNETDSYACLGNVESILANRISFTFNLSGSSMAINAACASSLVAVHEARRALLAGECHYAIAGGVNLNLHPWKYISFSKSRMLSPDGQCKTFDKDANGYVPGDGVGVILLQRLEHAVNEGNHIYGVIKGSAVNHCGKSLSITAPRVESQREALLDAYGEAGFSPETVTYVEAHGTGTSLGDPIEIEALTQAFRKYTDKNQFCKIGSVKTNIGHLEAAAGVAGIIKVILMMRHKKIPPTLNIKVINPIINFKQTPFAIATGLNDWEDAGEGAPFRAGVSSFGFGGVNAHVLLEQFPAKKMANENQPNHLNPFVLSAKNTDSLKSLIQEWTLFAGRQDFGEYNIRDICMTLLFGRKQLAHRCGIMVKDKKELKKALQDVFDSIAAEEEPKKKWCLRIGDFAQENSGVLRQLITSVPVLKQEFDLVLKGLNIHNETLDSLHGSQSVTAAGISFLAGYTLAAAYISLGFAPELVTGEKTGIWTALAISGIVEPGDAAAVVDGRLPLDRVKLSRPYLAFYDPVHQRTLMPFYFDGSYVRRLKSNTVIGDGLLSYLVDKAKLLYSTQYTFKNFMLEWDKSLRSREQGIEALLEDNSLLHQEQRPLIAAVIMSSLRKLSKKWGLKEQRSDMNEELNELLDLLEDNVLPKDQLVDLFLHQSAELNLIAGILNDRQRLMDNLKPYRIIKEHNSNVHEWPDWRGWIEKALSVDGAIIDKKQPLSFLDLGRKTGPDCRSIQVKMEEAGDFDQVFKESLLALWLRAVDIKWDKLYSNGIYRKVSLPVYPFNRKSFWLCGRSSEPHSTWLHPLVARNDSTLEEQRYSLKLTGREHFMSDHVVANQKTLPGAVYLEMALASGTVAGQKKVGKITNITWARPITAEEGMETARDVFIGLYANGNAVDYKVWTAAEGDIRLAHAQGKIVYEDSGGKPPSEFIDLEVVRGKSLNRNNRTECYRVLEKRGFDYGPSFQVVREFFAGETEGLSLLELPVELNNSFKKFMLHPSLVDGAFQTALLLTAYNGNRGRFLPFSLGEVHMAGPLPERCYACVKRERQLPGGAGAVTWDIYITDVSGRVLVKMRDFTLRESRGNAAAKELGDSDLLRVFQNLAGGKMNVEEAERIIGGL